MSAMADHWPSNDGGQGDLAELVDDLIDQGARDRQRLMGAALLAGRAELPATRSRLTLLPR